MRIEHTVSPFVIKLPFTNNNSKLTAVIRPQKPSINHGNKMYQPQFFLLQNSEYIRKLSDFSINRYNLCYYYIMYSVMCNVLVEYV